MSDTDAPKRLSRAEMISAVARHTNLRRDVVELVYDGLADVTVSEIVNKGAVRVLDTFDVTTKEWGKSPVTGTAAPRLITRITRPVRELLREIRMGRLTDRVTADNWRDYSYTLAKHRDAKRSGASGDEATNRRPTASEMFDGDY